MKSKIARKTWIDLITYWFLLMFTINKHLFLFCAVSQCLSFLYLLFTTSHFTFCRTTYVFQFYFPGPKFASSSLMFRYPDFNVLVTSITIILSGAFLAFLLTVSEYLLVANISSLALSIAGILKVNIWYPLVLEIPWISWDWF